MRGDAHVRFGRGPAETGQPQDWHRAAGLPHVAKVKDGGAVRNKAVNIAVGIDCEGVKHVLGIWVAPAEGAKAWAAAFAQLRNRGLEDVIICCCDGLGGLGEEITATWPEATVQTCTVHLIRAAARYGSYADRKDLCAAMRPIYTAVDADAAEAALIEFADSPLGGKYPAAAGVWERAWERFTPFLEFEPAIRKVIYTTDENVNRSAGFGAGFGCGAACPAAAA